MTQYPIPPKEALPDPTVNEKKGKRKKILEKVSKKRAKMLKRLYKG